jgi:hypothetical protein
LSATAAMEQPILILVTAGHSDEAIAMPLTPQGYRSPQRPQVLPSTVTPLRLTHGLMHPRHPSHPRRIAGMLTGPPLARAWAVTPPGGDHLMKRAVDRVSPRPCRPARPRAPGG